VNPKPGVSLGVLHTTSQCFIDRCPGELEVIVETICESMCHYWNAGKGSECHLSSAPNLAMGSMKEGG
jgi:hypothetical protein